MCASRRAQNADEAASGVGVRARDQDSVTTDLVLEVEPGRQQTVGTDAELRGSTLESERQAQISAANARLAAQRDAALAQADATRAAARSQVESAVAEVVSSAVEIATGKKPDSAAVTRAVTDALSAGVR